MNPIKKSFALLFLSLASCSTGYHSSGTYAELPVGGYSDSRISSNTAVVSYDANIFTSQDKVANYLLYRCAQITLSNGFDYFVIISTSSSPVNINLSTHDSYNQYQTNPPKLYTAFNKTSTYHSYSTSQSTIQSNTPHKEVAVIKMFQGKVPGGLSRAYSAVDVIAHVGASTL